MTDSVQEVSHSTALLDVGKNPSVIDQLLVTRPRPQRIAPSEALGRVKNFLPKLQEANQSLQERLAAEPQQNLDIENIEECSGPIIEMNIAIQEDTRSDSSSDTLDSSSDSTPSSSASSSDEEDGDEEDSSTSGLLDEVSINNIKMPTNMTSNKRKRPRIEVLSEEKNSDEDNAKVLKDR